MASHTLTIGRAIVDDYWKEVNIHRPDNEREERADRESNFLLIYEGNTTEEKEELIAEVSEEFLAQDTNGDMVYSLLLHSLLHNFNKYIPESVLNNHRLEV
ncbi:TPA: hypothetical protein SFZ49_001992, partial [Campylobacter jejuni]|nr:hypothetical protein [Campylobacter jejuni]